MNQDPKPRAEELWGIEDEERVEHDRDDAIESWLDKFHGVAMPETVTVIPYRRREIGRHKNDAEDLVSQLLDDLDSEYGDPDGDSTDPTPAMIAAADALIAAIHADYMVWQCEPSGPPEEVNVAEWIAANRPDWIEEKGAPIV